MKTLIKVLPILILTSCSNPNKETPKGEFYSTTGASESIEIVKVRDCEYVLWHKGYGSDMEHYEGCQNPNH